MPCWRCQSNLSAAEHAEAIAWDLCQACQEQLRGAPPAHASDEAERAADAALAGALDPESRVDVDLPLRFEPLPIEPLGAGVEISRVSADESPRRRAIAVYTDSGDLLAMCAPDVELGGVLNLARAVGAPRRLVVEEVEA